MCLWYIGAESMAEFPAKCIGMLGSGYNRDKELVAVSYIKIDFSSATQGREEWCHLVVFWVKVSWAMDIFNAKYTILFISGTEHSLLRYLIQILVFEVAFIKTQKIKHPVLNIWCLGSLPFIQNSKSSCSLSKSCVQNIGSFRSKI